MNEINWPAEFSGDDSQAWRNIKDYSERMKQIAFYAQMNAQILKGE